MKNSLILIVVFCASLTASQAQTNTWTGAIDTNWGITGNWSLGTLPTVANDVIIPTGSTVDLNVAATVKSITTQGITTLNWSNQLSLTDPSSFSLGSTVNWSNSNLTGGGTLTNFGAINLTTSINKSIVGGTTLNNEGTITFLSNGNLNITDGVLNNQATGVIDMHTDDGSISQQGFGSRLLNNFGLIKLTVPAGSAHIIAELNNTGTISVESGTLYFTSLTKTLNGGTYNVSTGASMLWTSPVTVEGTLTGVLDGPIFWGGVVTVATSTTATFDFSGTTGLNWSNGYLTGGGTLINLGILDVTGGSNLKSIVGGTTLNNEGVITLLGSGDLSIDNGVLNNQATGVIDMQADGGNIQASGTGSHVLNNAGLIKRTVGTNTAIIYCELNNTGTINVESGTLEFQGGLNKNLTGGIYNVSTGSALIWNGPVTLLGILTGALNGVIDWDANVTVATSTTATFDFTGAGGVNWSQNNLTGGGTLTNLGAINLVTSNNKSIIGLTTLNNEGVITFLGSGDLKIGDGVLNNQTAGVIDMHTDDGSISHSGFGSRLLNNFGLIKLTVPAGSAHIIAELNNTGTINVEGGRLYFTSLTKTLNGGTYNVSTGASMSWTSPVTVEGTLTGVLDGPISWGGVVTVATSTTATFDFTGTTGVNWFNGYLTGGGTLTNKGLLNLNFNNTKSIVGATTLNNEGMITLQNGGNLNINDGIVNNQPTGTIDIQDDASDISYSGLGSHILNNAGLLKKTSPNQVNFYVETTNTGIIDVQSGELEFSGPNALNNTATGTVMGIGTLDLPSAADFTNDGTFAPGGSPGTLSVIGGDFESTSTSVLDVELNSTVSGTGYDVLAITGNAIMDGSVNISLGFDASLNDEFVVATTTGTITTCNLAPTAFATFGCFRYDFSVACRNNNEVVLTLIAKGDVEPPTVVTQNIIAQLDNTGNVSIVPTDVDNGSTDNCTIPANLVYSLDISSFDCSKVGNPVTVALTVTDEAGNFASDTAVVTVQDNIAPAITCPANITMGNDTGVCGAVVNYTAPLGTDNCPGATTVQTAGLSSGSTFPVGTTTNTFEVTDASGNVTNCSFDVTVNDTENPVIACPANIIVGNDTGLCGAVVNYTAPVFTDNCPGATTIQTAGLASGSTFPVGTTTNTFEVTDASGNVTNCSFDITVNDTENPVITCPANIIVGNDTGLCGAVVNYTVPVGTDNCPGATTVQIAGLASGSTFPIGTTTNTFEITDASGNVTSCSFDVTVNDTENPVITCPANISVGNDTGLCSAVVNYTAPIGTDNCPGANTLQTAGLASGSTFPVGITTNTFQTTDAAGNVSTCSFDVTVNDSEGPNAVTQNITVQLDATGNATITANDVDNGSSDNCAIVSITLDITAFDCTDVGTNIVTLTVTDAVGLIGSSTATVTVFDSVDPLTVCQDISIQLDSTGNATITGAQVDNGSSDACGVASLNVVPNTFDTNDFGPNTVTLTVTDSNGNTNTCSAIVTVENFAYVYENGAWTPGDPSGVATANDDIFIINGTTALTADTEMNDLNVSFGATLNVEQAISVNGNIINDGSLVFVNDATKLGQLDDMTGSTITGGGSVTVQRHIPARDADISGDINGAYRYITSAVNSTGTINSDWQEGAVNIGDNPNPGFGMFITGSTTGTNGFDATPAGAPSVFEYDYVNQAYLGITNTDVDMLHAGFPYVAYVWGDRGVDIVNTNGDPVATTTTLRSTGSLITGNKANSGTFSIIAGEFNLFGNPYQAIVDIDDVMVGSTNLNPNFYYVWDPNLSMRGAYATVDLANDLTSPGTSTANEFLQPGQAAFVTTLNPGTAAILFEETDKDVTAVPTDVFKPQNQAFIALDLYEANSFANGSPLADAFLANFATGGTNAVDARDALKPLNPDENVGLMNGPDMLSIENRALPSQNDLLQIYNDNYRFENYVFKIEVNGLTAVDVFLEDAYLGTQTILPPGINTVNFSVFANAPASIASDRFSISFAPKGFSVNDAVLWGFTLYPNPVKGDAFFILAPGVAGQDVQVAVYDLLGRKVHAVSEQVGPDNRVEVSESGLQAGVYMVELSHGGKTFTEKLIVE